MDEVRCWFSSARPANPFSINHETTIVRTASASPLPISPFRDSMIRHCSGVKVTRTRLGGGKISPSVFFMSNAILIGYILYLSCRGPDRKRLQGGWYRKRYKPIGYINSL